MKSCVTKVLYASAAQMNIYMATNDGPVLQPDLVRVNPLFIARFCVRHTNCLCARTVTELVSERHEVFVSELSMVAELNNSWNI